MCSSSGTRGTLTLLTLLIFVHISVASARSTLIAQRLRNLEDKIHRRQVNISNIAEPISIPASGYWDGNDGLWSTFPLQVGTPPQPVFLTPSTAGYNTWVVMPEGCPASYPDDCSKRRGNVWNYNDSSTWTKKSEYSLGLNGNLGINVAGAFGWDTIMLGYQGAGGPSVDRSVLAYYFNTTYFLGVFGLKPQATNFTDPDNPALSFNDPQPSFLDRLRTRNAIPSLSWAYTAGNRYRQGNVFGSLTLGGFDSSRFVPTNVTYPMAADPSRDLVVNVQSIELRANDANLATYSTSFQAFVDSTLPYLYLPLDACQVFERTFRLTWNSALQHYVVNGTLHEQLLRENPSVTLTLGPQVSGGPTTVINLPYAAFDHNISFPIVNLGDTRYYFPLRRGTNDTQYTLGRVFFQEAYVIADYDRRNFTVAPCKWDDTTNTPAIRSILNPELASAAAAAAAAAKFSGGLSTGAKAGIAVGAVAIVALLAVVFLLRRRRDKKRVADAAAEQKAAEERAEMDRRHASAIAEKIDNRSFFSAGGGELGSEGGVHEMEHDRAVAIKCLPELDSPDAKTGLEMEGDGYFANDRKVRVDIHEVEGSTPGVYELEAREKERERRGEVQSVDARTELVSPRTDVSSKSVFGSPVSDEGTT
ncbi:hypothetical protein CAC42_103 [Sphaceloma murrayae]|uniref:Peptidase A1 domain-containing protein n=1 Tax=Sphaceloma murrayae TaxID=2082308 RepID=A0A2K1QN79_9PEZI|nr:hypothetical protein CAC42_103 [Sphaceloma murrayae]